LLWWLSFCSNSGVTFLETTTGWLKIEASRRGVVSVDFVNRPQPMARYCAVTPALEYERNAKAQLAAYVAGTRTTFTVPLDQQGTDFEVRVWKALLETPYGETTTYGVIAERVGSPGGAQAVGQAVGKNPIAIIVPCHRVLPASGQLGGYASGPHHKQWLLDHERAVLSVQNVARELAPALTT
jgi:methylated-DNA-[protein]-cysteine S-methyltransferase